MFSTSMRSMEVNPKCVLPECSYTQFLEARSALSKNKVQQRPKHKYRHGIILAEKMRAAQLQKGRDQQHNFVSSSAATTRVSTDCLMERLSGMKHATALLCKIVKLQQESKHGFQTHGSFQLPPAAPQNLRQVSPAVSVVIGSEL